MLNRKNMSADLSHTISVFKAFAIFSVICAHCVYSDPQIQKASTWLGAFGVPIFLICAGYLMNPEEAPGLFWRKKLKRVLVPWVLYALITYLAHILDNSGGSLSGLFLWWIGYHTWLYFPTILIVYYFLFSLFRRDSFAIFAVLIFLISNWLEIWECNYLSTWIGTPYLNFFNRIGWFALGVLIKKHNLAETLAKKKVLILPLLALVAALFTYVMHSSDETLVGLAEIPLLLAAAYALFLLASLGRESSLLQNIGNESYIIYFLHMQFGMLVANVLLGITGVESSLPVLALLLKPTVNLLSVYTGILFLKWLLARTGKKKWSWIFGLTG